MTYRLIYIKFSSDSFNLQQVQQKWYNSLATFTITFTSKLQQFSKQSRQKQKSDPYVKKHGNFKTFKKFRYCGRKFMNPHPNAKPGEKYERRTFYGVQRENIFDYIRSCSLPIINFRLSATGVGRMGPLRIKLESLLGSSVFLEGRPHPCFHYLMRKLIFYEAVNCSRKTEYKMVVGNQNCSDLNDPQLEKAVKDMVAKIIDELAKLQTAEEYRMVKGMKREERLEVFARQMAIFRGEMRKDLYAYVESRQKKGGQLEFMDTKQYVEELILNVDRIQPLRESQQFTKYGIFEQRNKAYFETALLTEKKQIRIKINRPSSEMEPLLQTAFEVVGARDPEVSYRAESALMVKDIFEQLKSYEQGNSTETSRVVYEQLHPSNVIFDQISLSPKLYFLPLVLDLFGLRQKPMSIEARIAFSPTPAAFDYFRSPEELPLEDEKVGSNNNLKDRKRPPNVSLILKDPFYGNIALYDSERHKLNMEQLKEIDEEQRELERIKGKILTWRFLLLSHYLMESREFGYLPGLTTNDKKMGHFRSELTVKQQSLGTNMSLLSQFLGSQNQFVSGKTFNFAMAEVGDFMSIDNDDSVVESTKYMLIRKYFQLRNLIIKQFIRLLVNDKIFGRIFNIKKYIFLYLTISIEILEEARKFTQVERVQARERKKLRLYLDKELRRLKSDKNHFGYLQTTYEKIDVYRNRDPSKDHQAKFAKEEEVGKKAIAFVEEINKVLQALQGHSESLNQLQTKEVLSTEDRETYGTLLSKVEEIVKGNAEKARGILNEFIFNELRLKHREGPHRVSEQAARGQKEWFNMYTNRLELLTLVYISMSEQNFITYDTIVLPLFRIDDTDKKFQIPKGVELLDTEVSSMKLVGELIESTKLIPRKMIYLATKTINQEIKIYERNRQSEQVSWPRLPEKARKGPK